MLLSSRLPPSIVVLSLLVLTSSVSDVCSAFGVLPSSIFRQKHTTTTSTTSILSSSKEDDYDAWLEKLDPSVFEETETEQRSRPGGRNGGFASHDYSRDYDADQSKVDEGQVDRLLADRLQARKTGNYDKADAIRDELMQDHGVSVWDKERLWRSGCSPSGSGRGGQWGNNNDRRGDRGRGDDRRGNDRFNDRRGGNGRDINKFNYRGNDRLNDRNGRGGGSGRAQQQQRRPKQDFGPNGHDYDYSTEAGPISSPLSEPDIHGLIARRLQCKLNRNFREADAIQQELADQGVFVHDGQKEWRADGNPFPTGNSQRGERGGNFNANYKMSPFSKPLLDEQAAAEMGPEEAEKATLVLKQQIQEMIDDRVAAKQDRVFHIADAIRDDLQRDYGVLIDDRKREWSVGGTFDGPPGPYALSPYSLPLSSIIDNHHDNEDEAALQAKLQSMVDERLDAKLNRDFVVADAIREDLIQQYNVVIDDRGKMWSIGGVFEPPPEPYKMSSYSYPLPDTIDVERVNELVNDRDVARQQRDFNTADDIKIGLREDFNILIDDKLKQWSVGGNFGPQNDYDNDGYGDNNSDHDNGGRSAYVYTRRGGGTLSEQELATVEDLIAQRAEYQLNREFRKADGIRDSLRDDHNVGVDDRNREWHVLDGAFVQAPSSVPHGLDDGTIQYIQEQVNQRERARVERDYDMADSIRDALMDQFAVHVDDRLKEWIVVVDPSNRLANVGPIPPVAEKAAWDDDDVESLEDEIMEAVEADNRSDEMEDDTEDDEDDDDEEEFEYEYVEVEVEEDEEDEQQDEGDEAAEEADLTSMTVVQLKELLRAKGLPVSGKKAELIERLQ